MGERGGWRLEVPPRMISPNFGFRLLAGLRALVPPTNLRLARAFGPLLVGFDDRDTAP